MKSGITPLMIFLLLLLILVVFLLCNKMFSTKQESFVSFLHDESIGTQHILPQYHADKKLYKLYDHIFYDSGNGNMIEVESTAYDNSNDESGETITGLNVIHRNSNSANVYSISSVDDVIEEQPEEMKTSFRVLLYETVNKNTDKYKIVYMPFDKKTFIYIFNNTTNPIVSEVLYFFDEDETMKTVSLSGKKIFLDDFTADDDRENNREVLEIEYNNKVPVFQLSKYVQYDKTNGNILVRNKETNKLQVHKRKNADSDNMQVKVYKDESGGNSIFSVENNKETLLFILGKNEYDIVTIKNLKYFQGENQVKIVNTEENDTEGSMEEDEAEKDMNEEQRMDRNKYLLKTEIVPPVCPKCPKCPAFPDSKEICANCGGQGGSGTMTDKGDTLIEKDSISKNREMENKKKKKVSDESKTEKTTKDKTEQSSTITQPATTNQPTKSQPATTGQPSAPTQPATTTQPSAPTQTSAPAQPSAPTHPSAPTQPSASTQPSAPSQPATTTQNTQVAQPIEKTDPYSYNGQLPSKGFNNFLPRTANFSSFGK